MAMKIVTINIPDQYLDCIESMVNLGYFPSRSEAVRQIIKSFLQQESELNRKIELEYFKTIEEHHVTAILHIQKESVL